MSPGSKVLIVLVIAMLGVWGCAQGPALSANAERIRALETKLVKLEDDFRSAVGARDQLRKRVSGLEEERTRLTQQVEQLQVVVKERDVLRKDLAVRTVERDSVQTQLDQFRKGIRTLLGQIERASGGVQPVSAVVESPSGKS